MSVRVVARIVAQKGKEKDLENVLRALVAPTRKEKGCVSYHLLQNAQDPTDFTFVEEWESEAALDVHLETPHLAEAVAKGSSFFAGAPDIRRYRTVV